MNFKNAKAYNFEGAFRGLRNPMNSWNGSDSFFGLTDMYMEDSLTDVCEAWIDNENIGRRERGAEELSHDMENYEEYYDVLYGCYCRNRKAAAGSGNAYRADAS